MFGEFISKVTLHDLSMPLLWFQASKDYVLGQILGSLDSLVAAVENKSLSGEEEDEDVEEPGHFVATIDAVSIGLIDIDYDITLVFGYYAHPCLLYQ